LLTLLEETIAKQNSEDSTPSAHIAVPSAPAHHPLAPVSTVPSTSNLDMLVAAAASVAPIIPSTNRRPVRAMTKRTYEDLDENGELETETGPTTKKRDLRSGAAGQQAKNRGATNRSGSTRPRQGRK
jgi:hypothetical protein